MSIVRIINQAKSSSSLVSSVPVTSGASPLSPSPSSRVRSPFEDEEEEPKGITGVVTKFTSLEKKNTPKKPSTTLPTSSLNKFSEFEDDWNELEFENLESNLANSTALHGSTEIMDDTNKLIISSDDEDTERNEEWDGLEVPANSNVFLKKPLSLSHPLASAPKSMLLRPSPVEDSNSNETEDWGIPDSLSPVLTPEKREVVEEVWSDVEFPNQPMTFRHLNPSSGRQVVAEDLSDLVFPPEGGLVLSTRHRAQSFDETEEDGEEWTDIVVPENFSGRLKK